MTAAAKDIKASQLGSPDTADPLLLTYPVEASTKIFGGTMVAINASGNAVPASASSALKIVGRCEALADNSSGAAGLIKVQIRQGCFKYSTPSSGANQILAANLPCRVYASDDNTVNLTDGAGLFPYAGVALAIDTDAKVFVQLGAPYPYPDTSGTSAAGTAFTARAVATSIAANTGTGTGVLTGSSNGAIGAQDGVTLVAGDQLFIPEGTANVADIDAGPWVVTTVGDGSNKYVLTRPDWWAHGSKINRYRPIVIGPEGTKVAAGELAREWLSFVATDIKVVDTDAPLIWARTLRKTITLASGTYTIGAGGGSELLGLRSTTASDVKIGENTAGGTTTSTTGYRAAVASRTAGKIGTGAVTVIAHVAAGTINVADNSTLDVTITNW